MKRRRVIVAIDDLMGILKDYCPPEDIPSDAMPEQLLLKPNEMGRLAILAESQYWQPGLPPLEVRFEIRRLHSV